jgi:transcriptional regulator with XRE-family HTH domain
MKRLREAAGLSLDDVAEQTDVQRGAVNRMENAATKPNPAYLRLLLPLYGVPEKQAKALTQLAKEVDQTGWWSKLADSLTSQYLDYIALESSAKEIHNYESTLVPGLLQTRRYAETVMREMEADPAVTDEMMASRVEARMQRKARLSGADPLALWAIVDESVLRRPTGGADVMREQLAHLIDVARQPNVTLQVVSNNIGAHVGMGGSYSLLRFPSDVEPDAVYVDTPVGELWLESQEATKLAAATFDRLRQAGLDNESTIRLIRKAAKELPNE